MVTVEEGLFTITTTSTYRILPFNRAAIMLQTDQQQATMLQTALQIVQGDLAAQEGSAVREDPAVRVVREALAVPEDLAVQVVPEGSVVPEDLAVQVVPEDLAVQVVPEDLAVQVVPEGSVVPEDLAAQGELVVPRRVLTIHKRRGRTTVGRPTFPARARFPIMGKSATPTAATREEIRREISPQGPPAAIDPHRRVALATRRADMAGERMPEAIAAVRSVVIKLAELRNATVTADAPVWAVEAAAEVVEVEVAVTVEEVAEVVEKEVAEVVAVGAGAADDAKPGRKSTQSAQKPLTIWSG